MVATPLTYRKFQGTVYKARAILRRLYTREAADRYAEEIALRAWFRHLELDDSVVKELYVAILETPAVSLRNAYEEEHWL